MDRVPEVRVAADRLNLHQIEPRVSAASLYITDIGVDWGKFMALGSLMAIPPLVFTFTAARQIITGLTAGAVKG